MAPRTVIDWSRGEDDDRAEVFPDLDPAAARGGNGRGCCTGRPWRGHRGDHPRRDAALGRRTWSANTGRPLGGICAFGAPQVLYHFAMGTLDDDVPVGGPEENHPDDLPEDSDPVDVEVVPVPGPDAIPRGEAGRYCYGYAGDPQGTGQMLSIDELLTKVTVSRMHPEVRRRVFAMMEFAASQGVPLGIGTGWRVQPVGKPGFAAPGNSNHEGFPCEGGADAMAADMVPAPSMKWMNANVGRFGLKTFAQVNGEPWHVQPIEIPNSRKRRAQPWALEPFPLPGGQPSGGSAPQGLTSAAAASTAATPASGEPAYALEALSQRPPRMPNHTLKAGSSGNEVVLLQVVLRRWHGDDAAIPDPGRPDGSFGARTTQSLIALQAGPLATTGDGLYGPTSHLKLQALSNQRSGQA